MSELFRLITDVKNTPVRGGIPLSGYQDAGISPYLLEAAYVELIREKLLTVINSSIEPGHVPKPEPLPKVEPRAEETVYIQLEPGQCHQCGRKGEHECPFRPVKRRKTEKK